MYIKIADLVSEVPVLATEHDHQLSGVLAQMIVDSQTYIDSQTLAPSGYYEWKGEEFEEKTFYTNASSFLNTYAFLEVDKVLIEGAEVDHIVWADRQYIKLLDDFPQYTQCVVRAKWGFKSVPDDIQLAVKIQTAIFLRNAPLSNFDVVSDFNTGELASKGFLINSIINLYRQKNRFAYD